MLAHKFKQIIGDRPLAYGLGALLVGQALYFLGFGALFVVALVYVLVVALPYPAMLRSWFSRTIVATLLALSFLQVAATIQFFALPQTDFKVLSLIATLFALVAVFFLASHRDGQKVTAFQQSDKAAALTASFFVIPLAILCFWGFDPARITSFGGLQSPDGSAHNAALGEMHGAQHLTYRSNPTYYPKGFHIAQAVVMDGFNVHQRDQSWQTNAVTFVVQYLLWGFVLAAVLYYLARQFAETLIKKVSLGTELLLAVLVGTTISLFYILPFAQQGFLNFYYICSAFIASLLFVEGFKLRRGNVADAWFVLAYFLFGFGITMSWGPLVLPVLVAMPALYLLADTKRFSDLRVFFTKRYLPLCSGFALLLIPLAIHFAFSDETSFNAHGAIRIFNVGLVLAGVGLVGYAALQTKLGDTFRSSVTNILLPSILLVGGLAAAQYLTAGEPRYYTIKTSYLFEMIIIVILAVLLLRLVLNSKLTTLQQWIIAPVIFGIGLFLAMSLTGNPLTSVKAMLLNRPAHLQTDLQKITQLGQDGEIKGHNIAILHYNADEDKLFGNELIINWASGLSPNNEGTAETSKCNGVIYNTLTYGTGSREDQKKLIQALNTCADLHKQAGKPYYIVTDPESTHYLKQIIGDKAIFL